MDFTKINRGFVWISIVCIFAQPVFAEVPSMVCELHDPSNLPHTYQVPGSCDQRKVCVEYVVCYHEKIGRDRRKGVKETAFNAICPSDNSGKCPKPSECAKANIEKTLDVPYLEDKKSETPAEAARKLDVILKDTADAGITENSKTNTP